MATWRITAPRYMGGIPQGESFIVVTRTTGAPDAKDIEEVLYINGYKESGNDRALSYRSPGNWECEKISDDTYPAWNEQHKRYEEEVARDKEDKQNQKKQEAEQKEKEKKEKAEQKKQDSNSGRDNSNVEDDSCYIKVVCTIILVLPIWWVIKLCIKCGISIFAIPWWIIKAICYVITWPIRAMLCCCLTKEQRRFLPKWTFKFWPAYSFKRF